MIFRSIGLLTSCVLFVRTVVYSLTFIHEEYSHVRLRREIWHPNESVHFKFVSGVENGNILTATNRNSDELSLHLKQRKLKLNIGGENYELKGLSGITINKHSWVDIQIKQTGKVIYFTINDISAVLQLSRRTDWLMTNWSNITFGAKGNDSLPLWRSFIGCIEFPMKSEENTTNEYTHESQYVLDKCVDACDFMTCRNGGRCVNNYKNIICDCRSTGYEGKFCENPCAPIHFDGLSYLDFVGSLENDDEKVEQSVRFKTVSSHGIIFSALFANETLLIEIFEGSIIMTWYLNRGTVRVLIGEHLHDGKWHHLHIIRYTKSVYIRVDATHSVTDVLSRYNGSQNRIQLSIGGLQNTALLSSSLSRSNFHGCLQSLYLNEINILKSVNRSSISRNLEKVCDEIT